MGEVPLQAARRELAREANAQLSASKMFHGVHPAYIYTCIYMYKIHIMSRVCRVAGQVGRRELARKANAQLEAGRNI